VTERNAMVDEEIWYFTRHSIYREETRTRRIRGRVALRAAITDAMTRKLDFSVTRYP
jgi:hypothetical protein